MSETSSLRVAEIFASIQGEGLRLGMPSAFIRLSGCNLRCRWCDTPYASWNPEGPVMPIDQIVEQASGYHLEDVVITGGEPMLFEPIVELCDKLVSQGLLITIETAGTIFRELKCDLMSISPKLSNSAPDGDWHDRHEAVRGRRAPLARLVECYNYQLKFVMSPRPGAADPFAADLAEIWHVLDNVPCSDKDRVLLMPEGTDAATLADRMRALAPICLREGFRLAPRLHVELFGNTRGT